MDFGELKNDTNFVSRVQTSSNTIENIRKSIQDALEMNRDEMSVEEKVKLDLFLAYAVNSLYFMYLKVEGEDIGSHEIKHELNRVKEAMQRQQQIHDKKFRPKVESNVAKRFVKSGLYDFNKKNEEFKQRYQNQQHNKKSQKIDINYNPHTAQNRKRKFDDD